MSKLVATCYAQYKNDTRELSTWLAVAAINHGFPIDELNRNPFDLQDDQGQRTAQQLKNAQKKAKQRAKAQGKENVPEARGGLIGEEPVIGMPHECLQLTIAVEGGYLLKIPHFVKLADYLVQQDVSIPIAVMQQLRRCIDLRVKRLNPLGNEHDVKRQGHAHFIDILQEVARIFTAHMSSRAADTNKKGKSWVSSNPFDALNSNRATDDQHEEREEDVPDLALPEPPRPPGSKINTKRAVYTPEIDLEEGLYRVLAFYTDVHEVRDYVKELWENYRDGKTDLISAAVTTNTALELLRKPHEDLVKNVLPLFQNGIPHLLLLLMGWLVGAPQHMAQYPHLLAPRLLAQYDEVDEHDEVLTSLKDFLLVHNYAIVGGVGDLFRDGMIPLHRPGWRGTFDPLFGRKKFSYRKDWQQCEVLLLESYTDHPMLLLVGDKLLHFGGTGGADNQFSFDEMAVEMHTFSKKKEPTLLLMAHSEIWLDIIRVMGPTVGQGFRDMRRQFREMSDMLKRRKEIESRIFPPDWTQNKENMAVALQKALEDLSKEDPMEKNRIVMERRLGRSHTPSRFMKRAPMLCGTFLFQFKLYYQELGFDLANSWCTIMSAAHLVTACRHYDTLSQVPNLKPWPDIDFVMDMHGKEDLFGGKMPRNIDESMTAFLDMRGWSREVQGAMKYYGTDKPIPKWLRNVSTDAPLVRDSGPRGLKDHSQIIPIFFRKYCGSSTLGTRLDVKSIENLLADVTHDLQRPKYKGRKLRRERKHKSPKYSVVQLLSIIEAGLKMETSSIHFDYVSMHLRCIQFLKKVKMGAHDYLVGKHGESYLENDSQLPYIVAWILQVALFSDRAIRMVLKGQPGADQLVTASKLLIGAINNVNEMLADGQKGRIEVDKMERQVG